jgi:hypothetical protein
MYKNIKDSLKLKEEDLAKIYEILKEDYEENGFRYSITFNEGYSYHGELYLACDTKADLMRYIKGASKDE